MRTRKEGKTKKKMGRRYEVRYRKRFLVRFGRDATDCAGVILNLSDRGVFVASTKLFKPGNQLLLDFTVDGEPYSLEGVVRWARRVPPGLSRQIPSGMGIEILSPPRKFLMLLADLDEKSPETIVRTRASRE